MITFLFLTWQQWRACLFYYDFIAAYHPCIHMRNVTRFMYAWYILFMTCLAGVSFASPLKLWQHIHTYTSTHATTNVVGGMHWWKWIYGIHNFPSSPNAIMPLLFLSFRDTRTYVYVPTKTHGRESCLRVLGPGRNRRRRRRRRMLLIEEGCNWLASPSSLHEMKHFSSFLLFFLPISYD